MSTNLYVHVQYGIKVTEAQVKDWNWDSPNDKLHLHYDDYSERYLGFDFVYASDADLFTSEDNHDIILNIDDDLTWVDDILKDFSEEKSQLRFFITVG